MKTIALVLVLLTGCVEPPLTREIQAKRAKPEHAEGQGLWPTNPVSPHIPPYVYQDLSGK